MQIIKKYCVFLLKFDHFQFTAIFQRKKVEMIIILTKHYNSKPGMC